LDNIGFKIATGKYEKQLDKMKQ